MPNSIVESRDCMEAMREFPDKFFELAVVDPPYFNGPERLGYYGAVKSKTKVKRQAYTTIGEWGVPGEMYFSELVRVSKNQIIWGYNYYQVKNLGSGRIIWDKRNDQSTFSDGEIAYCSLIDTVRFYRFLWNGMLQDDMKNKEVKIHPTQKPVALYKWMLTNYAKPGDKILDTHLGSGSSRIAAWDMGFDFWGYELDPDYFAAMDARFQAHISKPELFVPEQMYRFEQAQLFTPENLESR